MAAAPPVDEIKVRPSYVYCVRVVKEWTLWSVEESVNGVVMCTMAVCTLFVPCVLTRVVVRSCVCVCVCV